MRAIALWNWLFAKCKDNPLILYNAIFKFYYAISKFNYGILRFHNAIVLSHNAIFALNYVAGLQNKSSHRQNSVCGCVYRLSFVAVGSSSADVGLLLCRTAAVCAGHIGFLLRLGAHLSVGASFAEFFSFVYNARSDGLVDFSVVCFSHIGWWGDGIGN